MAMTQFDSLMIHRAAGHGITFPKGFSGTAVRCGLKMRNKDLAVIVSEVPATVAGMFTTNLVQACSVGYCKRIVAGGKARAIFCNSGNANACTGPQGDADNLECASLTAKAVGCTPNEVLVASTGVIGRPMAMDKVQDGFDEIGTGFEASEQVDRAISHAILTTDTRPKQIAVRLKSPLFPTEVRIGGVAKGSGMIAPNMATTLCFLTTDADIPAPVLQKAFAEAIERSFNRITVDGDTSTNDMALILANGQSGVKIENGAALEEFEAALHHVCLYLAKEVCRDGEGATKLVTIRVSGAKSEADAVKVAKTIAESPLVKTALFGSDPNWGRILAAAGRSGVFFDMNKVRAFLGDFLIFENGQGALKDKWAAHEYLTGTEVDILVDIGQGGEEATVWTCDYSYDYVRINAEYHT